MKQRWCNSDAWTCRASDRDDGEVLLWCSINLISIKTFPLYDPLAFNNAGLDHNDNISEFQWFPHVMLLLMRFSRSLLLTHKCRYRWLKKMKEWVVGLHETKSGENVHEIFSFTLEVKKGFSNMSFLCKNKRKTNMKLWFAWKILDGW